MQYSASNRIFLIVLVAFNFLSDGVFCCAPNPRPNPREIQIPVKSPEIITPEENDKTFFNGQYLPIGSSGSCPRNMVLFDGPNKQGFCDCLNIARKPAFYSDKTGECFFHNTRVSSISDYRTLFILIDDWKFETKCFYCCAQ
jgi:hypothetical protein